MIIGSIIGALVQLIPTGYIVITGQTPAWARVVLGVWLCLWSLLVVSGWAIKRVQS